MKGIWKEARQRAYDAIDLGMDFATLGGYGLEQIDGPAANDRPALRVAEARRTTRMGQSRPALFDHSSIAA